jgi:hypothetical protein
MNIKRILSSSKVHVALTAVVAAALTLYNVPLDVQTKTIAFVTALCLLAGTVIAATGYEDAHKDKKKEIRK